MLKKRKILQKHLFERTIRDITRTLQYVTDVKSSVLVKGYLLYKTITSQNVSSEAQIKNFFIL